MDQKKITERIQSIRKRMGLTQEEMADEMSVSRSAYINFERGRTKAISRSVYLLAKVAGIDVEEVLFGEGWKDYTRILSEGDSFKVMYEELKNQYKRDIEARDREIENNAKIIEAYKRNLDAKDETLEVLRQQNKLLLEELGKRD